MAMASGLDAMHPEPPMLKKTRSMCGEINTAVKEIQKAMALRQQYQSTPLPTAAVLSEAIDKGVQLTCRMDSAGVLQVANATSGAILAQCDLSAQTFSADYHQVVEIVGNGFVRTHCHQRLETLTHKFDLHVTEQGEMDTREMGRDGMASVDFFDVCKVDNHIHLAAAFHAPTFSEFVREKLRTEGDTVVLSDKGKEPQTLAKVFADAGLDENQLGLDAFHILADHSLYQRFDRFNARYSPWRRAEMRTIFLKSSNHIKGRFFGELTRKLLDRLEYKVRNGGVRQELRISVYGADAGEWTSLAGWVLTPWKGEASLPKRPLLSECNRWIIQIPRLYTLFRNKIGPDGCPAIRNFGQMMANIFEPLALATLHPDAHPQLAELLTHVVAFDSVDDESKPEEPVDGTSATAWTATGSPNYSWQLFHLWANLRVLNALRAAKGLNTITLRPHCGESGDVSHLIGAYLCASSINHGICLAQSSALQYLYYIDRVGLSISPISNHFLFLKAQKSPFLQFFKRGLNIALSTDDPMLFHLSNEPLLEEYSTARTAFDLSMLDMCELARNSVLQSGFGHHHKQVWLGESYADDGDLYDLACDPSRCNVTVSRATFRTQLLETERSLVAAGGVETPSSPTPTLRVRPPPAMHPLPRDRGDHGNGGAAGGGSGVVPVMTTPQPQPSRQQRGFVHCIVCAWLGEDALADTSRAAAAVAAACAPCDDDAAEDRRRRTALVLLGASHACAVLAGVASCAAFVALIRRRA